MVKKTLKHSPHAPEIFKQMFILKWLQTLNSNFKKVLQPFLSIVLKLISMIIGCK